MVVENTVETEEISDYEWGRFIGWMDAKLDHLLYNLNRITEAIDGTPESGV